jgi:lipopolysaccharide transport system permease protein
MIPAISGQVELSEEGRASIAAAPRRRTLLAATIRQVFDQLQLLTGSDLKSRYGRGGWQLVKWLIDPFALMGVYLLLVRFIFYRRPYAVGLSLACSIIPFQLMTMTVTNSLSAVQLRRSIIANMPFRRELLPVSTALTEAVGFAASLTLLALMMALYGIAPASSIVWLPVTLAVLGLLGIAVAYPMTLIGIWAPDVRGLVLSAVRAAYFLAPGLVTLSAIHGRTNDLVRLNPLTGLFEALRHSVLYRSSPPAWELLYPLAVAVLILAISVPLYRREQQHFAKVLQ